MKVKSLTKKIRRLEKRLREGPKKLAKLRRKLEAAEAAEQVAARKKSAARARAARLKAKPTASKKGLAKTSGTKKSAAAQKMKRKLNLSDERRAQLAAAMKARWAAKKAAAQAEPRTALAGQGFTLEQNPQVPENRPDGG